MKKFLLLAIAVATASVAMAQWNKNLQKSSVISQLEKNANKSRVATAMSQRNTEALKQMKVEAAKSSSRRGAEDKGVKGVSQQVYVLNDLWGLTFWNMFSEIKYYVTSENAYLSLYDLDYMEGVIEKGDNRYTRYGADSITFKLGAVAYETKSARYVYGGTTITMTQESTTAERNNVKSIGAYYFAEEQELYIPVQTLEHFIAIYDEMADEPTKPIDGTVIGGFDILPESVMNQYTYKATWTASRLGYDQKTQQAVTTPMDGGEASVFLASDGFYVKGIYPANWGLGDAWVFMELSEDETQVTISWDQILGTASFYVDDEGTETDEVVFIPISVLTDYSDWADDHASVLFVDYEDESVIATISSDGMTSVSVYGLSNSDELNGSWLHMTDLVLTISNERIDDDAINDVKAVRNNSDITYSISGQRVGKDYKGIVVKGGKKYLQK